MKSSQFHNSPGYTIACNEISEQIRLMSVNKARPRCIAVYRIRKAVGLPETVEGIQEARSYLVAILTDLVEDGKLTSFEIKTKYDGGAEWAFLKLPRPQRKRTAEQDPVQAGA